MPQPSSSSNHGASEQESNEAARLQATHFSSMLLHSPIIGGISNSSIPLPEEDACKDQFGHCHDLPGSRNELPGPETQGSCCGQQCCFYKDLKQTQHTGEGVLILTPWLGLRVLWAAQAGSQQACGGGGCGSALQPMKGRNKGGHKDAVKPHRLSRSAFLPRGGRPQLCCC